jgi:hypothetical protein
VVVCGKNIWAHFLLRKKPGYQGNRRLPGLRSAPAAARLLSPPAVDTHPSYPLRGRKPSAFALGVSRFAVKLRKIKTAGRQGGRLQWFHKFFAKQKTYSSKTAGTPFLSRARD